MTDRTNETSLLNNNTEKESDQRVSLIVKLYPFGLLLIGILLNIFVFGVDQFIISLPSNATVQALTIAALLLVINHTWIMTATALVRNRFKIYSTPEEWEESGANRENISIKGKHELERCHNVHRNTTENTIYFIFLALIMCIISPSHIAAYAWIAGFPVARLGYTYSYLKGRDAARGLFMSFSLLAMYGITTYIFTSVFL